jgi:hypothetical protein
MRIDQEFDCTQREMVIDIARLIYRTHGGELPKDPLCLWESQHPTEQAVLITAERIFEIFHGDQPDYSDDPDD